MAAWCNARSSWLYITFLSLVSYSDAASDTTALIVLSIATAIPALFLLTCCCTLVFVCYYRNKIPVVKSALRGVKKGGTADHTPKSAPPPATYPSQQGQGAMPPPAGNPSAPPAEPPPGANGAGRPVDVDDVVVPVQKD